MAVPGVATTDRLRALPGQTRQSLPAEVVSHLSNISLVTLPTRLFVGANSPPGQGSILYFAPLVHAPFVATPLAVLLAVVVLVLGLLATRRLALEPAAACMMAVSFLVSPTTWDHYLILMLTPAAILLDHLRRQAWPAPTTLAAGTVLFLLALPDPLWLALGITFFPSAVHAGEAYWGVAAALMALAPVAFVIALATIGVIVARQGLATGTLRAPYPADSAPGVPPPDRPVRWPRAPRPAGVDR